MRRKLLCITAAVISGIVYMHFLKPYGFLFLPLLCLRSFSAGRGKDRAFAKVLAILLSRFLAGGVFIVSGKTARRKRDGF